MASTSRKAWNLLLPLHDPKQKTLYQTKIFTQPAQLSAEELQAKADRAAAAEAEKAEAAEAAKAAHREQLKRHAASVARQMAVAALAPCTNLKSLTLQLGPDEFPSVTEHGLRLLPTSLQTLHLASGRPVQAWNSLAATVYPDDSWAAGVGRLDLSCSLEGCLSHPLEPLPKDGLAVLTQLHTLTLRSGCTERPPPEEDEPPPADDPKEVEELVLLRSLLDAAPGLACLDLSNAGPLLTQLVAQLAPQVPRHQLLLSCHSRVDPLPLLRLCPAASLALVLKGASAALLQELTAAAAAVAACHPPHRSGGVAVPSIQWQHAAPVGGARGLEAAAVQLPGMLGQVPRPQLPPQGMGCLVCLHFQRSHELTTELLAQMLRALPRLSQLLLTTCRSITHDLVVEVAKLRRPIRLRVTSCRLVSARGWAVGVREARDVSGSFLVDVRWPSNDDLACEVAFE